ncbi:WYL domain-containing protein [Bradyrhizobium liaoningense]|uniref:WYL domain-containing protein n=1 Tax=Bradyrhizobium liaoningense TaxID=43992 RepID=UPI001BABEED6|nr:WYL domain-containing protein [Bradyrhizobium liaoningense]MBR0842924.1 WYL domain-containing protein [Bradyrhizobium liaoningense]
MRWGVEKRLEFIEFRLFWEGGINRADIMEQFGVSVPQASKDLSLYEEKAPGNLHYDKQQKRYFASPTFKPFFLKPEADRYLMQLGSVSNHLISADETWLSDMPDADAMPAPHRRVDVNVLRAVLAAVRKSRAIEILYQSMNPTRPEPTWRWITPHAFGNDGLRWHVRAYCHIDSKFKDFLLSRCLDIRGDSEAGAAAEDDAFWNETFPVVLSPNPALSKSQQAIVAQDYAMTHGSVSVPVRKALLYYFQKRLRLEGVGTLDGPQETPVVISNREEFTHALSEAMA